MRLTTIFAAVLLFSCEENLPPYEDPRDLLASSVDAIYMIDDSTNAMNVVVTVRNRYDEQMEGTLNLEGRITITSARDNIVRRQIEINPSMIRLAPGYNPVTGRLVLNPNQVVRIEFRWNFVDDTGFDLSTGYFVLRGDPTCQSRCYAQPEDFYLDARVNLFSQTRPAQARTAVFRLWYITPRPPWQGCPPPLPTSQRVDLPQCSPPAPE